MIMEIEDTRFGERGVMFMADCGVIPEPTVDQLADIAVSTAQLARQLLGVPPRVALLSYSTKGSATHSSIGRVQAATALAQQRAGKMFLEADFDGELQLDAALVPEIAARKLPESKVAGRANVLIFPDLNSGNIGSKLVQHITKATLTGKISWAWTARRRTCPRFRARMISSRGRDRRCNRSRITSYRTLASGCQGSERLAI